MPALFSATGDRRQAEQRSLLLAGEVFGNIVRSHEQELAERHRRFPHGPRTAAAPHERLHAHVDHLVIFPYSFWRHVIWRMNSFEKKITVRNHRRRDSE